MNEKKVVFSDREKLMQCVRVLESAYSIREVNGLIEVLTAYLDRHNDCVVFYLAPDGDGMMLTDLGAVLGDLEMEGFDVASGEAQCELTDIAGRIGVCIENGEIRMPVTPSFNRGDVYRFADALYCIERVGLRLKRK